MPDNDLLTVSDVAKQLGISKYQVYRRITRGHLEAHIVRGTKIRYLITADSVADYIAAGGADILSPPVTTPPGWVRVADAATATGYSQHTIRQMCRDGRLTARKGAGAHGHYQISAHDVAALARALGR